MTLFFIVLVSFYAASVLLLLFGWARLHEKSATAGNPVSFISVIIPFRNEESNLASLIRDLGCQTFGTQNFEVILVDDHSTDRSVEIIRQKMPRELVAQLVMLDNGEGKKAALTLGITRAKGEIIVTTDADCRLPAEWLAQHNNVYENELTKMVIGTVRLADNGRFFEKVQAIEMASLIGTTGGTLGWGLPSMCNGANLSYRKRAFQDVGGFEGNENVASGDDEFLMRKIFHHWPRGIQFLADVNGIVTTRAQAGFGEFVQQRLRWAGKWRHNSSVSTRILAVSVWLFHFFFIGFFVLTSLQFFPGLFFLFGLVAKIFVEAIFLLSVCRFLQLRWSWLAFFFLQFFYSPYVVSIGFASQWWSAVWKGRSVTPRV